MNNVSFRDGQQVDSRRILYTPSSFARSCLMHLQEVGTLRALSPHRSRRSNLASYLFFLVADGCGELVCDGQTWQLKAGDCVFIDCRRPYSHSTGPQLWTLHWVHFNGTTMHGIYQKYLERGGQPVFHAEDQQAYLDLIEQIHQMAASEDHIRDMRINELLCNLLTRLMQASWHPASQKKLARSPSQLHEIKDYLDQHYHDRITLDELAERFFVNKFYLTRLFREQYGASVISYLTALRVSRAKELLRFSDLSIEAIGQRCGFPDANYFSRAFRKIEGISPSEYRRLW